jgi:fumarate reductase flavoprotein subunit
MTVKMNTKQITEVKDLETDIVVIGGGGTGFAAAVAAAEKGARVILLEKKRNPGGTSVFAGGLLGVESPVQKRLGITILKDDIFKIAVDYSHWKINPRIFRTFIEKSGDTIRWLENKGLNFGPINKRPHGTNVLVFHSLGSNKKTGLRIIETLRKQCADLGVRLLLNCPAEKILTGKNGEVTGVSVAMEGKKVKIAAKGIIIATGGYTGNKRLLKKYYPDYSENIVFLGAANTGDGLSMAMEIGAATEGLGVLLLHPHYYRGPVRVDTIAQEPYTMWVNKRGERFTDEAVTFRPIECGNAVIRQPDKCCYVLFDDKIKNRIEEEGLLRRAPHGIHEEAGVKITNLYETLRLEADKGGVKISDSWDEIAAWIGASPEVLKGTVSEYNRFCTQGHDGIFAKDSEYLRALQTPLYYAIRCFVSCLDTIGGIKINHHMEVLDKQDNPIPGLYAGGDAAGGWESDTYCILLPGSAMGFAVNSGRIAGENASEYVLVKK